MAGTGRSPSYGAAVSPGSQLEDLQDAIEQLGFRRYHLWLVIATFSFQLCAASLAGALPFMQKSMRQEFSLSNADVALLNSALALGAIPGVWLFGTAMDRVGRKPALYVMILGIALSSLLHQAVPGASPAAAWLFLLGVRCIAGVFFGGLASFNYLILVECLPTRIRGTLICVSQQGWSLSAFYVMFVSSWAQENWRWLTLAPLPGCALALFMLLLMPESPRWLFINGRKEEAMQLIHSMASSPALWDHVPSIAAIQCPDVVKSGSFSTQDNQVLGKTQISSDWRMLFSQKYRLITFCMSGIFVAASGAGSALHLFMPQIIQDKLGAAHMPYALLATSEALAILGFLAACWCLDSCGRRATLAAIFALTGFFTVSWLLLPLSYWFIVFLEISRNVAAAGMWPVMITFEAESFPTAIRGTGSAMCQGAGRAGALLMPAIVGLALDGSFLVPGVPDQKLAPFLLVAFVYWAGVLMSVLSPLETANLKLEDVA